MTPPTAVPFVCPRCHELVTPVDDGYACPACDRRYPIVEGIPDFRVEPDPWIDMEADRAKARRLLEVAGHLDFAGMVRAYWDMTPSTPRDLADRFTDHVLHAVDRSREWLARSGIAVNPDEGPWLDAGCGTADLAAAAGPGAQVTGVDVALRWLVVARRRLKEAGVDAALVCANAEALPFPAATFTRVLSLGLLEHCRSDEEVLLEARRVLRPGGVVRFRTVNRFSLLPEPHVGLWGVGFMPRRLARRYVRARTGRPYQHHHPSGPGVLDRSLRRAGFSDVRVEAAAILPAETRRLGSGSRLLAPAYEVVRSIPLARRGLARIAPLLEGRGVAA